MARTAVAAGTWTAVSNRVSRRQANRWSEQEQQQAYQQPQQAYQQPQQAYQQPQQAYQQPQAVYQQPQAVYQQPQAVYQQPAPAQSGGGRDRIEQLKDLADLKAQGILTEEEFATQKARLLAT
ncbi:MAG TPA: SHOCT domain-containing protein [Solirubrobacteraceae bacterium]